jgi:non-ribosomal peptide synthetase component E (peptide arylation enzyme)
VFYWFILLSFRTQINNDSKFLTPFYPGLVLRLLSRNSVSQNPKLFIHHYHNHNHHYQWRNSSFWATALLRIFCQTYLLLRKLDLPGFHFFRFRKSIFFAQHCLQSVIKSPASKIIFLYLCSTVTGLPNCIPRHWDPFWSSSTTSRARMEVFWTPSHGTSWQSAQNKLTGQCYETV